MLYWFRHRANLPQPKNAAPQGWDRCVNNIRGSHSHLCLKGSVASTFMMGAGGHLRWNENVELRQRLDQGKELKTMFIFILVHVCHLFLETFFFNRQLLIIFFEFLF